MDFCREDYWESVLFFTKHFKNVFQRDLAKRQKWFRRKWYLVILECLLYCCTHYIYAVEYLLHRRTDDFSVFKPDFSPFVCFFWLSMLFLIHYTYSGMSTVFPGEQNVYVMTTAFRKKSFLRHVPIRYTTQTLGPVYAT